MNTKAKTKTNDSTTNDAKWTEIYGQLQEDKVEFFLSTQLEPMVLIPGDGFQKEWPVDSQRFQDYLVTIYFEISEGRILRTIDRDFLMSQIREECRKGGRRLTAPDTIDTDEDVVVQAAVELMNQQEEFSEPTAVLVKKLRDIQAKGQISRDEIPIFTNIFSRKLNRLIPVLRGYGIDVVIDHKESGSQCTLRRTESFQKESSLDDIQADGSICESSGQSSGATPIAGTDLAPTDDSDGEFRSDPSLASNAANSSIRMSSARKGGAK